MRRIRRKYIRNFFSYVVIILGAFIFIAPLLWLLSTSFMTAGENPFSLPPHLFPHPGTFANYRSVFMDANFGRYLWNSLLVAFYSVAGSVILSLITAYPLAMMKFKGRNTSFALMIATLVMPAEGTLIPKYLMANMLGMGDNYFGVVVPGLFATMNVFLLRQAFLSLSKELKYSALVDGAGEWTIFWRIMTPLVMPTVATLAIMGFLGSWDGFLWPLVILNNSNLYTAPLGLAYFNGQFGASWQIVAAASVVVAAPVVILFIALQRYFINGIAGAFKG